MIAFRNGFVDTGWCLVTGKFGIWWAWGRNPSRADGDRLFRHYGQIWLMDWDDYMDRATFALLPFKILWRNIYWQDSHGEWHPQGVVPSQEWTGRWSEMVGIQWGRGMRRRHWWWKQ